MNLVPVILLMALPIAELKRNEPVDFEKELLPVLKNNCLACHNQTKAKAGLILETPQTILRGGDSGSAVVPGHPAESLLFKAAAHLDDSKMPPTDNKVNAVELKPEELGLLKLWIEQGAKGEVHAATAIEWQPLPDGLNPIYAVAITADGQFAACGRANDLFVYSIPTSRLISRITNAHQDFIQSLAFNPTGDLLASGSYGEVKLWHRSRKAPIETNGLPEGPMPLFATRPDRKRQAVASNAVLRLSNPDDGKEIAAIKGERYASERAGELGRTLTFAGSELAYRKTAIETAEKQKKTDSERLTKVTETLKTAEKTLQEKKQGLASATDGKNSADKALADLNAEVKKITDQFAEAEKLSKQATADAKSSVDKAAQAKLAATQASQTKSEAERIAGEAAAVAAKTKASIESKSAVEKPAAEKMADEAEGVAAKAKAFAENVASDAASKQKAADEAQTLAEKAIDEVAAKALALGQIKPVYEKTTTESPDKVKKATEKVTEAEKALTKADKEFKSAEIGRANSEHEVTLVTSAVKHAEDSLATAKAAQLEAEAVKNKTEKDLEAAKKAAADSEKAISAVAFSPDNALIAFADDSGTVHVRSAETGAAVETFRFGGGASPYLAFVRSDALIAGDKIFSLKDEWLHERTLAPMANRVMALDFSPDGKRLAAAAGEPTRGGEITLWNVEDGKLTQAFTNTHTDTVLAVDFSPDGKMLASGAADKFMRVLDLASGKVIKNFEGHTHHVMGVSWKRDGRTLV
ncbi:MAG TPA: c-type cytochrome domain-containing protein, partial [Pyrinomonadaceae bacterium]|nr:c-type cytochrome domain-containing protein [Pyrinomonadaceae bacterium]